MLRADMAALRKLPYYFNYLFYLLSWKLQPFPRVSGHSKCQRSQVLVEDCLADGVVSSAHQRNSQMRMLRQVPSILPTLFTTASTTPMVKKIVLLFHRLTINNTVRRESSKGLVLSLWWKISLGHTCKSELFVLMMVDDEKDHLKEQK